MSEERKTETMADFEKELEASLKRIRKGDQLTGIVISVEEDKIRLDLKYFAEGLIYKEELSSDPNYDLLASVKPGDEITALVIQSDDGEGHVVLSRKEISDLEAWDHLKSLMEERTICNVKIEKAVKGGVVTYLNGIRGFIPASKLAADYVEDLQVYEGKTIEVTVITADEETRKLILSGKEPALMKRNEETKQKIAKCQVGAVMEGTVDSIKDYGAFINLNNGLSGLLHISQISSQRIKHPGAVLKEGQTVTVKILALNDNKISLSMKAVEADEEAVDVGFDYQEEGTAATGLSVLLKELKF